MRTATDRSPWYRKRLADVDIDRLDTAGLAELPTLTKAELMGHFDDLVTDSRLSLAQLEQHLSTIETGSYLLGRYTPITSGGSTGERAVFVYDWESWAVFWLSCFRVALRAKQADPGLALRPAVLASVAAAHFSHATAAMARTFYGAHLTNVRFPVTLPTREIMAGLNRHPAGFPARLSLPAERAGARGHRPAAAYRAAPHPGGCRAAAARDPGRRGAGLGRERHQHLGHLGGRRHRRRLRPGRHAHQRRPAHRRARRPGRRPVLPGERSAKVYLTNLYNPVLPLIRYEITDEVTFLPGPCPCRSAHQRIADVQGRLDDVFTYQGRRVHPHLFRTALGREAGIVEYQVQQPRPAAAIAVRCTAPVSLDGLRDRVAAALARAGLERPQVTVEVVGPVRAPRQPGQAQAVHPARRGAGR